MNWYIVIAVTILAWLLLFSTKKYLSKKDENDKKD